MAHGVMCIIKLHIQWRHRCIVLNYLNQAILLQQLLLSSLSLMTPPRSKIARPLLLLITLFNEGNYYHNQKCNNTDQRCLEVVLSLLFMGTQRWSLFHCFGNVSEAVNHFPGLDLNQIIQKGRDFATEDDIIGQNDMSVIDKHPCQTFLIFNQN